MEETTREGFANVLAEIAKVGADAREAASRSRETSVAVSKLTGDVERLNKAVFGGSPPSTPPPVAVVARITEGEGTVADLTGRVMALQGQLAEHRTASEEYRAKTDAVLAEQTALLTGIKTAVTGVLTHPIARKVALAAAVAALAWLGTVQARIEDRAAKIEHVIDGGGR